MLNEAPRLCNRWTVQRRGLTFVLLAAWMVAGAVPGLAADRRFAVILAYPNKTFQALGEDADFANPAMVDAQYFDTNPNNDIYSLAEWWEEVSYGAVTVSGDTFGWLNLPWPLEPIDTDDDEEVETPDDHINLNFSGFYEYGAGEPFAEDPMPRRVDCFDGLCDGIPIDYNGDDETATPFLGSPIDAFAPSADPEEDDEECYCCAFDTATLLALGCDGFNVDSDDDGQDDSCGLSEDGTEINIDVVLLACPPGYCCLPGIGCVEVCNPAVSTSGCDPLTITPSECAGWNGTLIGGTAENPDPYCFPGCSVCGFDDRLEPDKRWGIKTRLANIPSMPIRDEVYTPGERYRDVYDDGRYNALFEAVMDQDVNGECEPPPDEPASTDYHDIDDDSERDYPEPFEDFLVRWDPFMYNGAGEWVPVSQEYIRSNYPLNPNWQVEPEIYAFLLTEFGYFCNLRDDPATHTDFTCVYFAEEMLRLREVYDPVADQWKGPLGYFDTNGLFVLDDAQIAAWTNVDEMAWRTGNGVYDPPERFHDTRGEGDEDRISTKMQHVFGGGDPWTTAVPFPGTYGAFDSVGWYESFWRARYGTDPPAWAKCDDPDIDNCSTYTPQGDAPRNSPDLVPFDPAEPHPGYENPDDDEETRRFQPDAGQPDEGANQEEPLTGLVEPDASIGFCDGWVEHDDLASSRYHAFGDQRLGEATSPSSFDIGGQDISPHNPTAPPFPDNKTVAAGPLALHVHGNNGLDAGNVLVLEWMTWRTDIDSTRSPLNGGWSLGYHWDWEAGNPGRTTHPYAGPENEIGLPDGWGFRDYNLDGLIDQGEVRPAGSENYTVDSVFGTPNDGTSSVYPFNRRRLLEDCIEILDYSTDFDLYRDTNTLAKVFGTPPIPGLVEGLVSGIVLFPPNAITNHNGVFPRAPSFYPIHTEDRTPNLDSIGVIGELNPGTHPPAVDPRPLPGETVSLYYNQDLWFHDLPAGLDRGTVSGSGAGGAGGDGGAHYQIRYAAHEYGHTWEKYPDLYDYRRIQPNSGKERYPVGTWCVMADGIRGSGYPGHPVADLKSEYSEWIEPRRLRTQLTPGVEREITFSNAETSKSDTYYYFDNPLVEPDPAVSRPNRARERFYFWRAGFPGAGFFDPFLPGQGLLILHANWQANDEGVPPQQGDPFTWNIIQADGDYDLDGGVNVGDAGDPFPGSTGATVWNYDTFPKAHSRWEGGAFSGIEITDIIEASGRTRVMFKWTPTMVPSLSFVNPPSGSTVDGVYSIAYQAYDLYAGTTLEFYYVKDDKAFDPDTGLPTYDGFPIAPPPAHSRGKETPRILESGTMPWDLTLNTDQADHPDPGVGDGRYYIYCRLVPGVGEEGNLEPSAGMVLAGRGNVGGGTLTSPTTSADPPVVDLGTSKLESWTVECIDDGATWSVEGSLSGEQQKRAFTDTGYSSDNGEVGFKIRSSGAPFERSDLFTFVTTGKTAYSDGLTVRNQTVADNPVAKILYELSNPDGLPPLTVSFDARSSDPNGAPSLDFGWTFGDGSSPATGDQVEHTYEYPGKFSVTLTATNPETGAFGTAETEIQVTNQGPTAVIEYTILTSDGSFPYEVRFSGSKSEDPEDLALEFLWTFDDRRNSTSTEMDPPKHVYFEDEDAPGWYCAEVTLEVTDSAGDTDLARLNDPPLTPGLAAPTVLFTAMPSTVEVGQEVSFDAEGLTIEPNDEPAVSYFWDFGDGETDTGLSATHTYDEAETYQVKFTLRYDSNCRPAFWQTRQVRVVEAVGSPDAPIALFTATPTSGPAPLEVKFDASDSYDPQGDPITFEWDFGDGAGATGEAVMHTYNVLGTFTVQLTVIDDQNHVGVASRDVTVNPPGDGDDSQNQSPVASFRLDPEDGPAPLTVEFSSTSSDPDGDTLTHEWDFGDGQTDSVANPRHKFQEPGSYTVTLKVTDPGDLSDSVSRDVEVQQRANNPPLAVITSGPTLITKAGELTLDATLSTDPDNDPLTYTWEISQDQELLEFGGPLMGPTLVVRFRNTLDECLGVAEPCLGPGVYEFVVTVEDGFGGKSVSSARQITFDPSQAAGQPGDGFEPGAGVPGETPITGSSRGGGGGFCGLGILMPSLLTALVMTATVVARRRRW